MFQSWRLPRPPTNESETIYLGSWASMTASKSSSPRIVPIFITKFAQDVATDLLRSPNGSRPHTEGRRASSTPGGGTTVKSLPRSYAQNMTCPRNIIMRESRKARRPKLSRTGSVVGQKLSLQLCAVFPGIPFLAFTICTDCVRDGYRQS